MGFKALFGRSASSLRPGMRCSCLRQEKLLKTAPNTYKHVRRGRFAYLGHIHKTSQDSWACRHADVSRPPVRSTVPGQYGRGREPGSILLGNFQAQVMGR